MGANSTIEWTDATWNPLTGCSPVSEGCRNCYAAREAAGRLKGLEAYKGLAEYRGKGENRHPVFNGTIRLLPDRLDQPLRWRKPRRIFVNSMSDLFHPDVPNDFIAAVFGVMMHSPQHTFQVLTKRPERMAAWFEWMGVAIGHDLISGKRHYLQTNPALGCEMCMGRYDIRPESYQPDGRTSWPLRNVWLGTSVENQEAADERIPHLLRTPAAVRFLSCEPLLGPVDLDFDWLFPRNPDPFPLDGQFRLEEGGIHWVIVGGESGPHARPMHPDWARQLRDRCVNAGVAFSFKQWGEFREIDGAFERWGKKAAGRELDGRTWDEYPEVADG